nr:rust resistance kinase Lr10-like [Ipomoea batatas]
MQQLIIIIFFTVLLPLLAAGFDDCAETRCRKDGPIIRFPFKLKHIQAQHCGYPNPGFELSCDDSGNTVMELPHALKLHVQMIHYEFQNIVLFDPHDCLFGKTLLYLNLSQSPFQYSSMESLTNYSLFNCSAASESVVGWLISCLGVPGHPIFAIPSFQSIDEFPSPSCVKFRETSSVNRFHFGLLSVGICELWRLPVLHHR